MRGEVAEGCRFEFDDGDDDDGDDVGDGDGGDDGDDGGDGDGSVAMMILGSEW